jgi:hypothetical protein
MLAGPVPQTKTSMFNDLRDPEKRPIPFPLPSGRLLEGTSSSDKVGERFPIVCSIMTSRELPARTLELQ